VNITDRFLEKKRVPRRRLQLVGITSLLIAAKFEEIYPPEIKDFVYICDKTYKRDDIINCEIAILTTLGFFLRVPTAVHFLDRYAKLNSCSDVHKQLAQYILELTLTDIKMNRYAPSHLASAAIFLTNKLLKQHPSWSSAMVEHTQHTEQEIKGCAKDMCGLLEVVRGPSNSLQTVYKKFSLPKHHCVAKMQF
jgi:transcription initiation factor TFIIIB Brf1 subunit/transcription initiation factor TFIIB